MNKQSVYLFFQGVCEEALQFYEKCFNGKTLMMMRFKDAPDHQYPEAYANKIMHAEFKAKGLEFMASDGMPGEEVTQGDQIHLALDCESTFEQDNIFEALSEGAEVCMPLNDTFWGARFGMLTDKYGIHWMLNYDYPQKD